MSPHHDAARRLDARETDGEPFGTITSALEDLGVVVSVALGTLSHIVPFVV